MIITWTPEKKDAVCKYLDTKLKELDVDCGEMMQQSDKCQEEAINILSDLVDEIIKPEMEEEAEE